MTHYGTWISYSGGAEIALAAVLAGTAAGVAIAGARLPLPVRLPRPPKPVRAILIAVWLLAIPAFFAGAEIYVRHATREHLSVTPPSDPITPVTVIGFGIIWFAIALTYNSRGWRVMLGSALIGALAGPMIFELPFDLIVMARTYPPLPPDPALYRAAFFAPLILIEVTTIALLALSPVARLSRATFWCLAGMLALFAGWALIGFAYPSAPAPFALNVASKILALLAALSMFWPDRPRRAAPHAEPTPRAWTSVM